MSIIIVVWNRKTTKKSADISNIFTKIFVQKNGLVNGTMKWIEVFSLVFIVKYETKNELYPVQSFLLAPYYQS